MSDIFDPANRPARDLAGDNWFSFKNVGDKVGGVVRDMFEQPARDMFPAQRCFTLQQADGTHINVGLKRTNYILSRTDTLQVGDELGVMFDKEIAPKVKGFHPAKSLVIFTKLNGERQGMKAKDLEPVKVDIEVGEDPEAAQPF